jgi:hypothetical protein
VVEAARERLSLRYIRQDKTVISDENFTICFEQARGDYLLLLSDDDLLWNGALAFVLDLIQKERPGVICLRAFGYDLDPAREWPVSAEGFLPPLTPDEFIAESGALITLISSCILRRSDYDPRPYIGSNLVHVPMILEALKLGPGFVTRRYWVACKRNNTGGYDFFQVFVSNLFQILDAYVGNVLTASGVKKFGRRLLLQFFPQYIFRSLRSDIDPSLVRVPLEKRFSHDLMFRIALQPVFYLPRWIALGWLAFFSIAGRFLNGDGNRIFWFVKNKVRRFLNL